MAGEQQVTGIVQQWTLDTTQAQASAAQLGRAIEASSKQGAAAATQLDGAMNGAGVAIQRATVRLGPLRGGMSIASRTIAATAASLLVAGDNAKSFGESLGGVAKNLGFVAAIAVPQFAAVGLAVAVVGGIIEAMSRKTVSAKQIMEDYDRERYKTKKAIEDGNRALSIEIGLLSREAAVFEDVLDAERRLVDLERERKSLEGTESRNRTPGLFRERFADIEDESRILRIAVARERQKQAIEEMVDVMRLSREVGKSEALIIEERIRLLDDEADALETTNALSGDDKAITDAQAAAYRKLADALADYTDNALAVERIERERDRRNADRAFVIGGPPVVSRFTGEMDEAATRAQAEQQRILKASAALASSFQASLTDATVDGLFEGFQNGEEILIGFGKRFTSILVDALFEALVGESTRGAALSLFKSILGTSGGVAAAQFGGTFTQPSITRIAEREPEVVLRARDLRALEQGAGSRSSGGVVVPYVVLDTQQATSQGVTRSLLRSMRPALRRPRNVAEARLERIR